MTAKEVPKDSPMPFNAAAGTLVSTHGPRLLVQIASRRYFGACPRKADTRHTGSVSRISLGLRKNVRGTVYSLRDFAASVGIVHYAGRVRHFAPGCHGPRSLFYWSSGSANHERAVGICFGASGPREPARIRRRRCRCCTAQAAAEPTGTDQHQCSPTRFPDEPARQASSAVRDQA